MHRILFPANACLIQTQLKPLHSLSTHHPFVEIPHPPPPSTPITLSLALTSSPSPLSIPRLHALALTSTLISFPVVSNSLLSAYSKSGRFPIALQLFARTPNPNTISYNTILSHSPSPSQSLHFASLMHRSGVPLDAVSFTVSLSCAADMKEINFGEELHGLVAKYGVGSDNYTGNSLVTMYLRCGRVGEARRVFDEMVNRDLVSWNALVSGLTQEGSCGGEAIEVFVEMVKVERPDHVALASSVSACLQEGRFKLGFQVHGLAVKLGFEAHLSVSNILMSMYQKYGSVEHVERVFSCMRGRDVVSWTTMISTDVDNAVHLFNGMRLDSVQPNDVTFVALIYALSLDSWLDEAQMIHGLCFKTGFSSEVNVSNSLISMYAKLGDMENSSKVFDEMDWKDVISWNSLVSGYAQNGLFEESLQVFSSMMSHFKPNQYTFSSILSAITSAQTLPLTYSQRCHSLILRLGLNTDEHVSGALIDMYSKHGSIEESLRAFDETVHKTLISWTAIISAHSKHGNYIGVMSLYESMITSGVEPDHITFLAILMACGGKGFVNTGLKIIETMSSEHGLDPWPEHYSCMVQMLGRAGRLAEAEEMAKRIPVKAAGYFSAWQSLLGACRVHGEVEMGERVAKTLMEMEPMEAGAYVQISNLYADKGEWESVARVRRGMRERGVKKEVGYSWVDVGVSEDSSSLHMYQFSSDDKCHPMAEDIYRVVECLGSDLKVREEDLVGIEFMEESICC